MINIKTLQKSILLSAYVLYFVHNLTLLSFTLNCNHHNHDEKQSYENYEQSQNRQERYYQGLYRDQHNLNLKLQEDIRELSRQNERLSALAKQMIREREAAAIDNIRLNEYNRNVVEAYNKTIEGSKRTRQKNRLFAFFLIGIIGFMGYKSYYDFSPSVKAVLGDNLLSKSDMSVPSWKVSDWYRGEMVLTRVAEKRYEFLSLVNNGNVTKEMIRRGVKGSFKGLPECDKSDPSSAINQGKVARYRFVLLEKNVVVSTYVPFSHLCR